MSSGWAAVIVASMALVFTVLSALAGLLIRAAAAAKGQTDRTDVLAADLRELIADIRDDRRATNERITWLERHAWPRARESWSD